MRRTRRCFARAVLSLMVFHVAALGASSLSLSASAPSTAAHSCRCCGSGGARMLTCPMPGGQAGGGCRLHCGPRQQSVPVIALPGAPLPTFVTTVRLASAGLSIGAQSAFCAVALPVPAPPPRETASHS